MHMTLARTNVTLPEELLRLVDELAGPRGRSRYVADAVAKQVKRDRLRRAIEETAGAMVGKPGWMSPDEVIAFINEARQDREV
jgi:metal-responsive CopG/Arc/MetJ family transcriptional regulator